MSKTGSYRFIDGEWIKVSDKPPRIVDAYVPAGGYTDESLGEFVQVTPDRGYWQPARIETREQKAALMKKNNVVEDGGFEKRTRRTYFGA